MCVCTVDLAASTGFSTVSPGDGAPNTAPVVPFTQREVQITIPALSSAQAAAADYGGVWLGEEDTSTKNSATDNPQSASSDYGGKTDFGSLCGLSTQTICIQFCGALL